MSIVAKLISTLQYCVIVFFNTIPEVLFYCIIFPLLRLIKNRQIRVRKTIIARNELLSFKIAGNFYPQVVEVPWIIMILFFFRLALLMTSLRLANINFTYIGIMLLAVVAILFTELWFNHDASKKYIEDFETLPRKTKCKMLFSSNILLISLISSFFIN